MWCMPNSQEHGNVAFYQWWTGLAEAVVEARLTLPNVSNILRKGVLKTYCAKYQLCSKHYATGDNIVKIDVVERSLQQHSMITAESF